MYQDRTQVLSNGKSAKRPCPFLVAPVINNTHTSDHSLATNFTSFPHRYLGISCNKLREQALRRVLCCRRQPFTFVSGGANKASQPHTTRSTEPVTAAKLITCDSLRVASPSSASPTNSAGRSIPRVNKHHPPTSSQRLTFLIFCRFCWVSRKYSKRVCTRDKGMFGPLMVFDWLGEISGFFRLQAIHYWSMSEVGTP